MRAPSLQSLAMLLCLSVAPAAHAHPILAQSSAAPSLSTPTAAAAPSEPEAMQRLEEIRSESEAVFENALPLKLEEALEIALSQSPTVAIRKAETRIAETQADSTRSSYRPTIGIAAGIELNTGSGYVAGSSQLGGSQARQTATSVNASISANQLIYDFGSHAARRRGAAASIRSALADEDQNLQDLRTDVIQQFLRAGAAREKLAVAQSAQRAEYKRAEQIDAHVEVGLRPRIDRATARANVANATARIISAATEYDLTAYDLLSIMGIDEDRTLDIGWVELEADELEQLDTDALRTLATEQRGEFRALASDLEAAEEGIRETKSEYLPTLNAVAGASESLLIGGHGRWNAYIGARLSWDIYRGGRVQFQKRELEARRDRLALQERTLLIELIQTIQRAQREIRGAKALSDTRRIVVENAARQLELAEGRYETGLGNIVELSDAQLAYTEAQLDEIDAALQLSLARVELVSAVAGWQ